MMRGAPRHVVIGDPVAPGVVAWQRALAQRGRPPADAVSWHAVLDGGDALARALAPESCVRIESPGRDGSIDARLVRRGGGPKGLIERGAIEARRAWYRGLIAAVSELERHAAAVGVAEISHRAEHVALAFDKGRCHAALEGHGVAVPEAVGPVAGWTDLRGALASRGWTRAFVKPCHGSAGSGVLALRCAGPRVDARTTVELDRSGTAVRLYNTRAVRRYTDERDVGAIVDRLADDGLHVERWLPKANWAGHGTFDLRVVVIGGEPTHAVARVAGGPITNLQLGAQRIHGPALAAGLGDALDVVFSTARRAATAFTGAWQTSFDVMLTPGLRRHAVLEANAFGDLVHGARDARGRTTHQLTLDQLERRDSAGVHDA